MVIKSARIAGAPSLIAEASSLPVAAAAPRLAVIGPVGVVRERGLALPAAGGGYLAGIQTSGNKAALAYLPDGGAFRRGLLAGKPAQASQIQAGTATKSTVHNCTYNHNSIQMTRPVPASWGDVGPHRVKEPGPA